MYPRIVGRYNVNGMTLIVSRGTGTWGQRMRLWHRAELLRIVLHGNDFLSMAKEGRKSLPWWLLFAVFVSA